MHLSYTSTSQTPRPLANMSHSSRSTTPEEEDVVLPDALASLSQRIDNGPEVLALGNKEMQLAALQAANAHV